MSPWMKKRSLARCPRGPVGAWQSGLRKRSVVLSLCADRARRSPGPRPRTADGLLVVLKANPANSIVSEVHDWAHSLAGPFNGMFSFHSANTALAVNWGIAAVLYLFVGGLIARLIGRTHC